MIPGEGVKALLYACVDTKPVSLQDWEGGKRKLREVGKRGQVQARFSQIRLRVAAE